MLVDNLSLKKVKASLAATGDRGWTVTALVGLYINRWECRYSPIKWKGGKEAVVELYNDIKAVAKREGVEATKLAIEALFSDKMRWVKSHMVLLVRPELFTRHVVPAMVAVREERRGEQSEWCDERDETPASRVVEL